MIIRFIGQVVITLILLWGLLHFNGGTTFVRTTGYQGVPPVTDTTVPLTADDIARGLKANPKIQVDQDLLEQAYNLRLTFAKQKSTRDETELKLGTHMGQVLTALEKTP